MIIPVVLAQFPVSDSVQNNLKEIQAGIKKSKSGDILIFPEGALSGYSHDLSFLDQIDRVELENACNLLREKAQLKNIHIWLGTCMFINGNWYNTALGFTPMGELYQYHKINLADHEREKFTAGSDLPVYNLKTVNGDLKVGIQICREIRFYEQWAFLAHKGAQLIIHINNAVNDTRYQTVWRSHLISHAASLQRFVASVNNASSQQLCPTMAVSPEGKIIDEIISDHSILKRITLDLSQVSNHYIDQRRQDVVSIRKPKEKERRQILRSKRIEKLGSDLDELINNKDILSPKKFSNRTEALNLIKIIEDMQRLRSKDRSLRRLYQKAKKFHLEIDEVNSNMFSHFRDAIKNGKMNQDELRATFNLYTDYSKSKTGQPHYGYEDLDGLVKGIFMPVQQPDESREREPGMIRYQPTPASVILELVDRVKFKPSDVFFDLGSGLGLVVFLVNKLVGVRCIGVEYQPSYCYAATRIAEELNMNNVNFINSDVQNVDFAQGTVFYFFNPFGGRIFTKVMKKLRSEAKSRIITTCSYGPSTEPMSTQSWLKVEDPGMIDEFKLAIFRSI